MNTNSQFYLYTTSSGIELIEGDKMPVKPVDICGPSEVASCYDRLCHEGRSKTYCFKRYHYEQEIERAKASGIHVQDQERAKAMIKSHLKEKNPGLPAVMFEETIYGPFTVEYHKEITCNRDCPGSCFHPSNCDTKTRTEVAILYEDTPEKEEQDAFLLHLIDVTACYVMEQNMYLETPTRKELIQKARETFTITRKQ